MATDVHRQLARVPSSLTQLHIILPSQHFGSQRKLSPEQRLMMAVLHDAVDCLAKYRVATGNHGRRLFEQTQQWFLAGETRWPYSFEGICGVLDLDADAVRQRLRVRPAQRTSARAERHGYRQQAGIVEPLDAGTNGN